MEKIPDKSDLVFKIGNTWVYEISHTFNKPPLGQGTLARVFKTVSLKNMDQFGDFAQFIYSVKDSVSTDLILGYTIDPLTQLLIPVAYDSLNDSSCARFKMNTGISCNTVAYEDTLLKDSSGFIHNQKAGNWLNIQFIPNPALDTSISKTDSVIQFNNQPTKIRKYSNVFFAYSVNQISFLEEIGLYSSTKYSGRRGYGTQVEIVLISFGKGK